ncbi:MAG: ArV2 gp10 [Pseudarthrobacter sp.]|nr:ArV2 gp10 [Pseudarthrobacter sp.]
MIDGLVFPDTKSALLDLIDGFTHEGEAVRAVTWLQAGDYGGPAGPFPLAHIQGRPGGTTGYVDRVDRRLIEVYAEGELALNVLESIVASICGTGIETPSGYLDKVEVDENPEDVPYQSDTLNKAAATVLVTSRPIN